MSFSAFLEDFWTEHAKDILQSMIARIVTFDPVKMRATIQPLMRRVSPDDESEAYSIVTDVPVAFIFAGDFYIRPVYKPKDLVWICFATHDIEDGLRNVISDESQRLFSSENCIVIGSVAPTIFVPPPEFSSETGLIIGHKVGGAYMVFNATAIKFKFGPSETIIDATGVKTSGNYTWDKDTAPTTARTHIHQTPLGPSGPPNPGS